MKRALGCLMLIGLTAGTAAAEKASCRTLPPQVASLIKSQWTERAKQHRDSVPDAPPFPEGPSWSPRASPPFPAAWPPDGKGRLVVYAFAGGMRPSLRDGEEVAAPWGRVVIERGTLRFEDLGELRSMGAHGVRPLAGEELQILRSADAAAEDLCTLAHGTTVADAPRIKRYYRQWMRDGGLAPEIRRLHPAFTAWLDAKSRLGSRGRSARTCGWLRARRTGNPSFAALPGLSPSDRLRGEAAGARSCARRWRD